ncbi:MAG TPA: UbiA prenyltransferase family protein [Micromonospora sp.]
MPVVDSATAPAITAGATRTRPGTAADLLALARPAHWAKSLLVVPIALVDAPVWTTAALGRLGWAVLAFMLAASTVYVGNDIADRHRDRHHPVKRHRPVAAGRIPVAVAWLYCAALGTALGLLLVTGPAGQWWPVLAYLLLNLLYSRGLKHVPLVEAGVVAAGFVLRVVQGYLATRGPVSGWLLVAVFAGCLLLIVGKRRQELLEATAAHRPALRGYSVELAGHLLQLASALTVTAGLLYLRTEAPFAPYGQVAMLVSTPLALFAMSRYLQLVLVHRAGGDPVRLLLRDRAVLVTGVLWLAALGGVLVAARFPDLARAVLP